MSKFTTTINEYLSAELQRQGLNEFVNDGKLTFNNPQYAFIQKILFYDEDVQKIVDDKIFKGFKFTDEQIDRSFKETFIARFLDREINRQTIEAFASQVLYTTLIHQEWILRLFSEDVDKYIDNHVTNHSEDDTTVEQIATQNQTSKENENRTGNEKATNEENITGKDTTENREAESTLPQNKVNINVDNDVLDYADNNNIQKDKKDSNQDTKGTQNRDTTNDSEKTGEQNQESNQNQDTNFKHKEITKTYQLSSLNELYAMKEQLFKDYDKKCFLQIW